ncbi:MAG TPA: CPBP family intramembrane glutamic endopeptidase [Candidatus Binatia bacterium]|nr:CPBP family intramembrane glutamic endopeptidase [Candidatus Binatia bacterium]
MRTPPRHHHLVRVELAASAVLVGLAGAWSALRGFDLLAAVDPSPRALAVGAVAGLTLAATLPLVTAPWAKRMLVLRGLRRAWDWLESGLGPSLGVPEVVVLALCSAVSEEIFFRGVLQREVGIVAASAVFGLLHPLGWAYVVWAGTVGAGLGLLFVATGSLAAPAAAHGVYNLVALVYLRRRSTNLTAMEASSSVRPHASLRRWSAARRARGARRLRG